MHTQQTCTHTRPHTHTDIHQTHTPNIRTWYTHTIDIDTHQTCSHTRPHTHTTQTHTKHKHYYIQTHTPGIHSHHAHTNNHIHTHLPYTRQICARAHTPDVTAAGGYVRIQDSSQVWEERVDETRSITTEGLTVYMPGPRTRMDNH